MSAALLFGILWSVLLLGLYLALPRLPWLQSKIDPSKGWIVVIAVALLARIIPNLALPVGAGYDIQSYQIVGNLVLNHEDIYTSPETDKRYPYLPMQMYWSALSVWSANRFHLPFVKIVRLLPIFADLTIAWLLYAMLLRKGSFEQALFTGLAYALNPLPVYVCAYHGQFDALPALSVLLALAWITVSPQVAGSWLGLGILIKSWPVLALPSLISAIPVWHKKLILLAMATMIPLLGFAAYVVLFRADPLQILARALGYNWGTGVWGYSYLLTSLPGSGHVYVWLVKYGRLITLACLGLAWWLKARYETPQQSFLTLLVVFFAITHAFGIQYLMWVVPFALLCQEHIWLRRYTLAVFAYMFLAYNTLILEMHITNLLPWPQADRLLIIPASLPAWIICIAWVSKRLRK